MWILKNCKKISCWILKLLETRKLACDVIIKCGSLELEATDLHFCVYTNYNHLMQTKNCVCHGTGMLSSCLCWGHPNKIFLWYHHTTVRCALLSSHVHDRHFLSCIFFMWKCKGTGRSSCRRLRLTEFLNVQHMKVAKLSALCISFLLEAESTTGP